MEGVCYGMKDSVELISALHPGGMKKIIASGGAARSPLWLKLQSDIYGLGLTTTDTKEHAGLGAAMLAGIGCGIFRGFQEAVDAMVGEGSLQADPDTSVREVYTDGYALFRRLYQANRELFGQV